jgi:hypothetical protein
LPQKDIEKKVNLTEQSKDVKKISIAPILFLYYEQSVLLLRYNKVYFLSSLIAKPTFNPSCGCWSVSVHKKLMGQI